MTAARMFGSDGSGAGRATAKDGGKAHSFQCAARPVFSQTGEPGARNPSAWVSDMPWTKLQNARTAYKEIPGQYRASGSRRYERRRGNRGRAVIRLSASIVVDSAPLTEPWITRFPAPRAVRSVS